MKELTEILNAAQAFAAQGERLALATIVAVQGSTYRREGARLLLTASQQMAGNISGGCLESDVMVVADEVMASGAPRSVRYDLTADDDAVWGLGLGCNGAVDLFVEPLDPASPQLRLLREAIDGEETLALVKLLDGPSAGRWMAVRPGGAREGSLGDDALDGRAARAAAAALSEGASRVLMLPAPSGEVRAFVEVIRPPLRLVVCGAGHDAIPVVQYASALGWRAAVVDQRERFLTAERFPGARQLVRAQPQEAAARVPLDERTYVVVMTHNYLQDRDLLRGFLATPVRYIGMLGPRLRTEKILDELRREGVRVTDADRARIFGPIGLDVGGEGPEAIALAILGEIQAVDAGRGGGFLRGAPRPDPQLAQTSGAVVRRKKPLPRSRRHRPRGRRPGVRASRRRAGTRAGRRVAAIILAAGGSRRLGRPKLLIPYRGVPMLRRAVDAAAGAGCAEVLVVLGADRDAYRPVLRGTRAREVHNPDFAEGMSSSIRAGIRALARSADAAVILLADQPRIDASIVRRLIEAHARSGRRIVACRYGPVLGAPALFDRALFTELLLLEGDQGARQVMDTHPGEVGAVEIPPQAGLDVDLPEDLAGLQGP